MKKIKMDHSSLTNRVMVLIRKYASSELMKEAALPRCSIKKANLLATTF